MVATSVVARCKINPADYTASGEKMDNGTPYASIRRQYLNRPQDNVKWGNHGA